jgi:HTH-type transcriptional regulator, competence development regulator
MSVSKEWLSRMAEAEDHCESFSVGGLVCDLGMLRPAVRSTVLAFGRLVELSRRAKGLSLLKLAETTGVDILELYALERGVEWVPEPRTVFQLSTVLNLPFGELQELSGLAEPRDELIIREAVRFAANSESTAKLSADERKALEEFVKVLSKRTEKG